MQTFNLHKSKSESYPNTKTLDKSNEPAYTFDTKDLPKNIVQEKSKQQSEKTGFDILDICSDEKYPDGDNPAMVSDFLNDFTEEKMQLDGTQRAVLELLKDYNEAKQKAEEATRLKEVFLANMSHEIRTPLNAIMGFSDLLSKRELGKQEKEFVKTIKSSGENLLAIINDILDISKIETGMMRFVHKKFKLQDVYKSVQESLRHKAEEKHLTLSFTSEEDVPAKLTGDPTRLIQIITNLTENAIKFTRKGKVEISVNVVQNESSLNQQRNPDLTVLQFSVTDTGIGIPKNKLKSIFERFQQAESHTTRKYGGSGLGLSIAKQLVELQGGSISVKSQLRSGSVFSFQIPYQLSDEPFSETTTETEAFNITDLSKLNILLVEDNKLNVRLISSLFSENNLKLDVAENGHEGIEKLKQAHFDIILMDMEMPVMDGYEATTVIRTKLNNNIPIIAMTAHAMSGEKEKCLGLGMDDYISKPVNANLLFEKIHELTSNPQTR